MEPPSWESLVLKSGPSGAALFLCNPCQSSESTILRYSYEERMVRTDLGLGSQKEPYAILKRADNSLASNYEFELVRSKKSA